VYQSDIFANDLGALFSCWFRDLCNRLRNTYNQKFNTQMILSSMGLRFFKRRNFSIKLLRFNWNRCFNGAALFQAQKCVDDCEWDNGARRASMGLRFFKRRNYDQQWTLNFGKRASMGLRFFKRRNDKPINNAGNEGNASMGLRFFKRRNLAVFDFISYRIFAASMGLRFFKRRNL